MSQELHLHAERAIKKIKEIVGHAPVCLFQTGSGQRPIPTRPMHTAEVDDRGHLWFLASTAGHCAQQLRTDPGVQLLFAHADEAEYMSIHGRATVVQDRARIQELRQLIPPNALGLATVEGSEADLCAIKVVPQDSYYWDAAENSGRSMVRMMVAGVFGQQGNEAVEGRLDAPPAQPPPPPRLIKHSARPQGLALCRDQAEQPAPSAWPLRAAPSPAPGSRLPAAAGW